MPDATDAADALSLYLFFKREKRRRNHMRMAVSAVGGVTGADSFSNRNTDESLKVVHLPDEGERRVIPQRISQFGLEVKHTSANVNASRNHRTVCPMIRYIPFRSASVKRTWQNKNKSTRHSAVIMRD